MYQASIDDSVDGIRIPTMWGTDAVHGHNNVIGATLFPHNIGKQSGEWTITWQGTNNSNEDFPGGSSIFQGIEKHVRAAGGTIELNEAGNFTTRPDVAIVVFGEEPYAEGHGDRENLNYQGTSKADLAIVNKLKAQGIAVISVFISGRRLWVNQELNAFVAAWLPGSEGSAVADVLFTDLQGNTQHDTSGRLSFSWPNSPYQTTLNAGDADYTPLFAFGSGLSYGDQSEVSNTLTQTYDAPAGATRFRKIYTGMVQKPWVMGLTSGATQSFISASTASLPGVTFRTTDRAEQEDAFRMVTNGNQSAGVSIASKSYFREDLSTEIEAGSVFSFKVKTTDKLNGAVNFMLSCESQGGAPGSCSHSIDIANTLNNLPTNEWHTLHFDLACFGNHGVDFSKLVVPFQLTTEEALSLEISAIEFMVPESVGKHSVGVQCQN